MASLLLGRAVAVAAASEAAHSHAEHRGGGLGAARCRKPLVALAGGRPVANQRGRGLLVGNSSRRSTFVSTLCVNGDCCGPLGATAAARVKRKKRNNRVDVVKTRAVASGDGGNRGTTGRGIIDWLARQFVNQAKCISFLRFPDFCFFDPRTWFNAIVESVVVLVCTLTFLLAIGRGPLFVVVE